MKLSGHSYNNDIFKSLLDGLKDDVVLKKTAQKEPAPQVDLNFSQTTAETFKGILEDELRFIANELLFAAKRANVEVTGDDLKKFAHQAKSENLRGKELERAARRYCTDLQRELAPPQGCTRVASSEDLIQQARASTIMPAGSSDGDMNHGHKGGYMGQSRNPNSIWDSEAIKRLASKPENRDQKFGDERIAESKEAKEKHAKGQKEQFWQNLQDQLSDPNMIHNKIVGSHTASKESFNPGLPKNAMSVFSEDRDFANIPDETAGEILKKQAEDRANKNAAAKDEWNKVASAKKADNTSFVFGEECALPENPTTRTSTQRSAVDKLFDGLANHLENQQES